MTAAQWVVLDNLMQKWNYKTNLDAQIAEEAYLACVRDEYIRDGKVTQRGVVALLTNPSFSSLKMETPPLTIRYRNYKGVESTRRIIPLRPWYGSTSFHPTIQWLLDATDVDKGELRTFAFRDILEITG